MGHVWWSFIEQNFHWLEKYFMWKLKFEWNAFISCFRSFKLEYISMPSDVCLTQWNDQDFFRDNRLFSSKIELVMPNHNSQLHWHLTKWCLPHHLFINHWIIFDLKIMIRFWLWWKTGQFLIRVYSLIWWIRIKNGCIRFIFDKFLFREHLSFDDQEYFWF